MSDEELLREMKRQTRIAAEKRASEEFGALAVVLTIATFATAGTWPEYMPDWPWWGWVLFVFGVSGACAAMSYNRMTKG